MAKKKGRNNRTSTLRHRLSCPDHPVNTPRGAFSGSTNGPKLRLTPRKAQHVSEPGPHRCRTTVGDAVGDDRPVMGLHLRHTVQIRLHPGPQPLDGTVVQVRESRALRRPPTTVRNGAIFTPPPFWCTQLRRGRSCALDARCAPVKLRIPQIIETKLDVIKGRLIQSSAFDGRFSSVAVDLGSVGSALTVAWILRKDFTQDHVSLLGVPRERRHVPERQRNVTWIAPLPRRGTRWVKRRVAHTRIRLRGRQVGTRKHFGHRKAVGGFCQRHTGDEGVAKSCRGCCRALSRDLAQAHLLIPTYAS